MFFFLPPLLCFLSVQISLGDGITADSNLWWSDNLTFKHSLALLEKDIKPPPVTLQFPRRKKFYLRMMSQLPLIWKHTCFFWQMSVPVARQMMFADSNLWSSKNHRLWLSVVRLFLLKIVEPHFCQSLTYGVWLIPIFGDRTIKDSLDLLDKDQTSTLQIGRALRPKYLLDLLEKDQTSRLQIWIFAWKRWNKDTLNFQLRWKHCFCELCEHFPRFGVTWWLWESERQLGNNWEDLNLIFVNICSKDPSIQVDKHRT